MKLIFKALHRIHHLFLVSMSGMRYPLLEDPETPIAVLQIRQQTLLLQKYNQLIQYDNDKRLRSKRRAFKLDVHDQDNKFLGLHSKKCHDVGTQNQCSMLGGTQS